MKFKLVIILVFLFSFTSCWNKDSRLTKKIVGEWRLIEMVVQDLSKADSKPDTTNMYIKWEFKPDKESFVTSNTSNTTKGTFNIHDGVLDFDFPDDAEFEMEKFKIYNLNDSLLIVGRRIEDVEYIRAEWKKLIIE